MSGEKGDRRRPLFSQWVNINRDGPERGRPIRQSDGIMAEEEKTSTLHFLDYWRVIRDRKEVVLAVALLTIVTGTFYTVMMPKKYSAVTQIETREDDVDVDPFQNRQTQRLGW